ncbi:hypothetical protein CFHF_19815 [Caulobacter flavus]|uniref:DUF1269 domain-containing family protein n=1 Tax=Caulobacter flavus TaxID=1679497 RepID=A0A2N5CP23_9CAUL|nr:hypothetical protein [Caulobacter flavus]AYV48584.1 hypothetical protein C1707_21250 [Caulobacter flavus]PLR08700.1 hypothetical protein CFHF_19815 [Caulobacter flavus]
MSHTITALFDDRSDADAGLDRLIAAGFDAGDIHVHDKTSDGFDQAGYSSQAKPGLWARIKNAFLPDEDRHVYEEGVRRGGHLLTADVADDRVADAVAALEGAKTVDIGARTEQWRQDGWAYAPGSSGDIVTPNEEDVLVYGVRSSDYDRAGVRSYVTDRPVEETLRLRQDRLDRLAAGQEPTEDRTTQA